MRFCQSFMTELWRYIGEHTDVPAGDIGVGGREIGYMFGQYKRLTTRYEAGVLTGKGLDYGGSLVRTEATGYGNTFFVEEMLQARRTAASRARRAVVSGSGNVAIYAIEKIHQLGGKVVACSDSNGYDPRREGHRPGAAQAAQGGRAAPHPRLRRVPQARQVHGRAGTSGRSPARWPCPRATQNEINGEDAAAAGQERLHRGRRRRQHAHAPPRASGLPGGRDRLRPGQGRQRRRRRHLAPWRCSRTPAATAGPSSTPRSG